MGSHLRLGAFGAEVDVEAGGAALSRLRELWSRCLPESVRSADEVVTLPPSELPLSPEMELRLTERVTLAGIDRAAGRLLMLHAAGLSNADGAVVGLVAPSGTGKSTAAITLARAGLGYVTDETLAVTEDLAVVAWPKPLALVADGEDHKLLHGPDELGLAPCGDGLRLRRLVVLDRDPAVPSPRLVPIDTDEARAVLVAQSSAFLRLPSPLRRLDRLVREVGGVWRLEYAEIGEAAPLVRELLEREVSRPPEPLLRYAAGPVRDALGTDDGVALLTDGGLLHLGGIGAVVWRAAHGGATFQEVHGAVVAQLGEHDRSHELVTRALDELIDQGLLHLDRG